MRRRNLRIFSFFSPKMLELLTLAPSFVFVRFLGLRTLVSHSHGDRDGRHLNEKVYPNPNRRDKEPMYIAKRVRHDEKKHFGKKYPWKYKK